MRYDQTKTMAVHGAAARMISPAVNPRAVSGSIHAENTCCMKTQARKAIPKGFTSQLTNRVTRRPRGRRAMPPTEPKSTLSIMG